MCSHEGHFDLGELLILPCVSIIIVNYNGLRYLNNLFKSLVGQTFKDFEIVFVDNASTDDSLSLVLQYQKDLVIKILKNVQNLGFSIANNQAFQLCKGKYIIFLNNDTYLDTKWLEGLVKGAKICPETGAITCSILHPNSLELQEGPAMYDIYGAALGPAEGHFFYGTGACLLTKRALLDKIGVFDPKLFMYQEDVDLCWRIRLCGYSIELESDAICYHLKNSNGLIEDNVKMPVWIFYNAHCKNRIRVLIKNYSKLNIAKRVPTAIFLVFARSWMLSLVNKKPQYLVSFVKGLFWNLYILSDTLRERWFVQSLRRKSDDEVAKYMLRFSVELSSFRMMVKNWSN